MNDTLEINDELLAVLRTSLPATQEELAVALDIAASRVPGLIRKLRRSGYPVHKDRGTYRGADQLDEHELAVIEHRQIAYEATATATTAAMFPTPGRIEAARLLAEERARLEAEIGKHRRVRTLEERRARIDRELAELAAS